MSPRKNISQLALIRTSMISLLVYFAMEVVARLYHVPAFWDGLYDGARGCAFGIALGCLAIAWKTGRSIATSQ